MDLGLRWISNTVEREQCSKWRGSTDTVRCTLCEMCSCTL